MCHDTAIDTSASYKAKIYTNLVTHTQTHTRVNSPAHTHTHTQTLRIQSSRGADGWQRAKTLTSKTEYGDWHSDRPLGWQTIASNCPQLAGIICRQFCSFSKSARGIEAVVTESKRDVTHQLQLEVRSTQYYIVTVMEHTGDISYAKQELLLSF